MTEQTPEAEAELKRLWQRFRERNPDLSSDRAAVEQAASEFIAQQQAAGATREDIIRDLPGGAAAILRQRLGSERMSDTLEAAQRRMWGDDR